MSESKPLVERLRDKNTQWPSGDPCYLGLRREAADEIADLRRDLAREASARVVLLAEIEAGKKRVAELERNLAMANDAAEKGDDARAILGGMALTADPPADAPLSLAQRFHEAYERLAPSFGYETRPDTRRFDPESKNGRLMVAVCAELVGITAAESEPRLPQMVAQQRERLRNEAEGAEHK